MAEKLNNDNPPSNHEDDAELHPLGGDRGIPQVGRKKPVSRVWWVILTGLLLVAIVAGSSVIALNKLKNRNSSPKETKDNAASNVPNLPESAFESAAKSDDAPPPLPAGTPTQPGPQSTSSTGTPQPQLTPAQKAALDLAARRKHAPVVASMSSGQAARPNQDGGRDGTQLKGNGSGSLGQALTATRMGAVSATLLPDPDLTLTQGRILNCTLETALNTDVAGMTSCVLADDVYSTTGRVLLMERGTRIVGQYQKGGTRRGSARLFLLWTRAETPNGVIVNLDSPSTDSLGRSGLTGKVNKHFWERFGSAILVSMVDDIARYAVAQSSNSSSNTNIQFGSTADSANDAAAIIVQNSVNIPPTIEVNQGATVGIFVARDVYFGDVYSLQPRAE